MKRLQVLHSRLGFRRRPALRSWLVPGGAAAVALGLTLVASRGGVAQVSGLAEELPAEIQASAAALRDEARKGTDAFAIVQSLATEVGPRSAGSAGDRLAVAWAVRTLKGLGLANVRTEPVKVPHWERGSESGEILAPYPQPVALCALGGSVGTPPAGIRAEVLGVPDLAALEKLDPAKAKGKILFVNQPMNRTRDLRGYEAAVPARSQGPSRAGQLGAVAYLVRSIGTDGNRLPHTGGLRYDPAQPRIPAAALSTPDADLLAGELQAGKPVTFLLKLGARELPEAESANVIGEVPGRDKPGEIVLLGCHLDSWDLGRGAIDDGAGCAIVLETARRIARLPRHPSRTIRVVLFANEEFGLSGARAYAEAHEEELPRHVLAVEADSGAGRPWRLETQVNPAALGWVRELNRALYTLQMTSGGNNAEPGADLVPLVTGSGRVPALAIEQDMTAYFDYHHTANDTLDKISALDLNVCVAAYAPIAYIAAEMPGDFGRVPVMSAPK